MSSFPLLKTGAVMQYPARRILHYSTEVVRFLDGREQRYREFKSVIHRWVIRLDLLDEDEMYRLQDFFLTEQGRYGNFSFVDPWNGTEYPNCSLESDEADFDSLEEARGRTMLIVKENRN